MFKRPTTDAPSPAEMRTLAEKTLKACGMLSEDGQEMILHSVKRTPDKEGQMKTLKMNVSKCIQKIATTQGITFEQAITLLNDGVERAIMERAKAIQEVISSKMFDYFDLNKVARMLLTTPEFLLKQRANFTRERR
jgi:hypothetical protein